MKLTNKLNLLANVQSHFGFPLDVGLVVEVTEEREHNDRLRKTNP